MILNYAFDQKDSAYQLYQTAFSSLQQKETTNALATHLAEQLLGLGWPELCDLVSVYPKAGKWMVQFWFDDEMGKVSDRIDQVITAFYQVQGLSFVEKTNSTLASENGSDLHWPDTVSEPTYTPIADGEFYALTFSLPSEDPQKIGIQLNTDQMVACIDYWQRRSKMKFSDMSMVVADLSADGDEVAQNLEHISDRLNQVGGVWTNAVNFSPFMRAASEQHNLITTLIQKDLLGRPPHVRQEPEKVPPQK